MHGRQECDSEWPESRMGKAANLVRARETLQPLEGREAKVNTMIAAHSLIRWRCEHREHSRMRQRVGQRNHAHCEGIQGKRLFCEVGPHLSGSACKVLPLLVMMLATAEQWLVILSPGTGAGPSRGKINPMREETFISLQTSHCLNYKIIRMAEPFLLRAKSRFRHTASVVTGDMFCVIIFPPA